MGACEPGQARDRAAISGNFHVPGFSLKAVFFYLSRRSFFPSRRFFAAFSFVVVIASIDAAVLSSFSLFPPNILSCRRACFNRRFV